ncbi:fumarylacetoacetate hydrolase family protein [Ornithinimicrobium faecis]|uniref:Fumarylacetoacetate hydrolase family protein n=1 Tax=Ornithinimicrobium faecis TaxID=2934158 RepID=A0ABY4YRK8_9MICO|nr:fumarylacetoacetate hydrolase family protein [Ornithinimicrobium sp. HY1793]USQ79206.1 fumarylacetoacetate hydrolase family protein [Ornithinimicrobium sp. HY1793]
MPKLEAYDRISACVKAPSQIVAVGLNYRSHAKESQMSVPGEPICFSKSPHSISGPNDDIIMPTTAGKLDWEVELALVVGAHAYQADLEQAEASIAGYCLTNDVSERTWQLEREGQWMKGKSAPTFCPTGPWFVPAADLPDPGNLKLSLSVNGKIRQQANTSSMIFSPAQIVSILSEYMVFQPGDLILTGTPEGVGMGSNEYLSPGDEVVASIEGLGEQSMRVVRQQ